MNKEEMRKALDKVLAVIKAQRLENNTFRAQLAESERSRELMAGAIKMYEGAVELDKEVLTESRKALERLRKKVLDHRDYCRNEVCGSDYETEIALFREAGIE